MDNVFQELDYSDISAKHVKGEKKFEEIDTKRRGGILKCLVALILFLLVLIFIIIVITKSVKINSLEDDIKETQSRIESKNNEYKDKEIALNNIIKNVTEIEKTLKTKKEELNTLQEKITIKDSENKKLNKEVEELTTNVNKLKEELENLNNIQESDLQKEIQKLDDEMERMRQSPMKR